MLTDTAEILSQIKACCVALDDKKAEDLVILDLQGKSSTTSYYIIATGSSNPHLRALIRNAEDKLHEFKIPLRAQKDPDSGWMILDAFDFMVHVFDEETREFYGLEALWNDGKVLDWQTL